MLPTIRVIGMSDRTRIGPAVNARLWERFRKDVEARKGAVRGNLGEELDNAIREYLKDGPTKQEQEIINRLERLESAVGAVPADGGTDTSDAETHTRAEDEPLPEPVESTPDSKPAANAATEKKIRWLADQLLDQEVPKSRELHSVPKDTIRSLVVDEYGFRSDTAKRYVEQLRDRFDLTEHPHNDKILVTTERRKEMIQSEVSDDD